MSDFHILEDQAVLYVMGQLTTVERREFEARLAESTELQALVRELEEGAVALSMASPRRRPPQDTWTRIEKTMAVEAGRKSDIPGFWAGGWRNGWAAATACLVGWLLYALWINHSEAPVGSASPTASIVNSQPTASPEEMHQTKTGNPTRQASTVANPAFQLLQAKTQEISALRWQMAELTNQMARLSQVLTQQQKFLAEPDRIKFFQLMPPSSNGGAVTTVPISTNLQQALFLAMARELGWTKTAGTTKQNSTDNKQSSQGGSSNPAQTNQTGVDFVDLHPPGNTANSTSQPQDEPETTDQSTSPLLASSSSNAVPGFVSGTQVVLGFDSTVASTGDLLMFWAASGGQSYQLIGNSVLGNNPQIVTIPFANPTFAGWNLAVSAITTFGSSNFVGQFLVPGAAPP